MGTHTTITWTDHTYNPWIGCQQVTEPECGDCYAKRWAEQHQLDVWGSLYGSHRHLTKTFHDPRTWNREAQQTGQRRKVFCASLADVFEPHPEVRAARHRLWTLIEETPALDWQLLTKRPKFILRLVPQYWLARWPAHVWIGTSAGIQRAVEQRLPYLLEVPAPIRFLSCEPLVEEITLADSLWPGQLQWVICGGYSGTQDHPMRLSWARWLRDECRSLDIAFFMKQLGSVCASAHGLRHPKGENMAEFPLDLRIREFPVPHIRHSFS